MPNNLPPNSESILSTSLSNSLLGSIFNAVPEGVLIVDKHGQIVYINEQMRDMWDFPDEMSNLDARFAASLLVIDTSWFRQRNQEINESDLTISDEMVKLKNGRIYNRSTKPLMIEGTKEGRIWTYHDISSQHHSLKLLEHLIDHAPIGIALAAEDTKFVRVNEAWAKTLGYTQSELIGTSFRDHTHPDDLSDCLVRMSKLGSGEVTKSSFEKRYIHKDGSVVDALIHVAKLPQYGQQDMRYIAQIVDLTQLKKAENALFQSQKLESIGILAGGIAHDFNNLLVAMTTQADVAQRKNEQGKNPQVNIEKIKLAAKNASYLTEQLLAYSGRRKFKVEEIDLNVQIEKNTGIFNLALPKNIELKQNLHPNLQKISAEKGQVQQILLNLIINASEAFEGQPGKITINTSQITFTEEDILTAKDYILAPIESGEHVLVSIADTGAGMSPETMKQIFDPFFTTKFTGRGLGLAAALGIIRGHGGAIKVKSQIGEGTTFELYFPSLPLESTSPTNTNHLKHDSTFSKEASENSLGVLLVDDDEDVRDALKDLFEFENIQLICAADGSEAIEKLATHKENIALTLLDLSMPGLSSPKTFAELKKINPDLPIMLCSGYSEQEISESFKETEIEGFIPKPFQADELINLVQAYTHEPE